MGLTTIIESFWRQTLLPDTAYDTLFFCCRGKSNGRLLPQPAWFRSPLVGFLVSLEAKLSHEEAI